MVSTEFSMSVSPNIYPYVNFVKKEGKLGICQRNPGIIDLKPGCVPSEDAPLCDRFKVSIPYAGTHLQWEVIFNQNHPEIPPDFIFGPNDTAFIPDIEQIKSLENWNPKASDGLLNVLEELLLEFRKYQLQRAEEHSRLQYEYSEIISYSDGFRFQPDDIEVNVTRKNKVFGQVNFLLKLPIEFSQIPSYLTADDPGEHSALLLLTIESPEKGTVKPQLFLSPSVKHALGTIENLAIPSFPSGGLLIDYIPGVCELLSNKVKQVSYSFEQRREYISCFLKNFEGGLLEYDSESYRKVSFLMEWHDFFFIITVDIPANFPNEQPSFIWQSVYHEGRNNKPFYDSDKSYPYSPRWKPSEMVQRAKNHILEKVTAFQKMSVTEGKLHVD